MPRGRRLVARSLVIVALSWSPLPLGAPAVDTPCDPSLPSVDDAIGYRARDDDTRCEGVYRSPVSGPGLQVVLVVLGEFSFEVASEVSLRLAVPDLADLQGKPVNVRAVAVPIKTYYRMDARLAPGETMRWPLGVVVWHLGLTSAELGVLGWIEKEGERILVPLRAMTSDRGGEGKDDRVLIGLRSAVDIDQLLWREIFEGGPPSEWRPVTERMVRSGQRVPFVLPSGPAGLVRLEFAGKRPNSDDWARLSLNVLRAGT